MSRLFLIIGLLLLSVLKTSAQYDVSFGHYWSMELNFTGAYAIQLAGFEHNPNTMYAAADMPFYALRSYHGVGIQFINDAIGLFSHKRIGLQYAYQPELFGGRLGLGLNLSMLNEKFDGSKLDIDDTKDPLFTTTPVNGSGFDIGLGLYYRRADWYAGFSVMHLNSPHIELGEKNELDISATYYLTGGYNIHLNHPFLTVQTSVLGRTDGVAYRADVSGRLVYSHEKRNLYGGLSYSPTNSVTVQIGGVIRGVRLGYSYEIYTSSISFGNGSHELFIGYQTDINLHKKGRNLHKSVRIL